MRGEPPHLEEPSGVQDANEVLDFWESAVSANVWNALIPNLLATMGGTTMGTTVGQAQSAQEADTAYLTEQGESGVGQKQVGELQFEQAEDALPTPILTTSTDLSVPAPGLSLTLERSFNSTIPGRYQLGSFGYGWSFLGDDSATTDPTTGDVYIQQGGTVREFDLVNGAYQSSPGDTDTLSLPNGYYCGGGWHVPDERDFRAEGVGRHDRDVRPDLGKPLVVRLPHGQQRQ